MKGNEGNEKARVSLQFHMDSPDEVNASRILDTMKRNQTDFVTFLIKMFIERNHIDVNNITKPELKAIMTNENRIVMGGGTFEFVDKPALIPNRNLKGVPETVAAVKEQLDDEDIIDSDMFAQLDAFG